MPTEQLWITFLTNAGFAAVTLAAVGFALWRIGSWIGTQAEKWITPVVSRHLEFIALLEGRLLQIDTNQTEQTRSLATISTAFDKQAEAMERLMKQIERLERNRLENADHRGQA